MNVYSGFIHSHQILETTQMSFNWGTDKQTMEYYSEIKGNLYTWQHGESKYITRSERSQTQKATFRVISFVIFL